MKTSPNFRRCDRASVVEGLELAPGEAVVGIYQNPPPWQGSLIVFTDIGMHVLDGKQAIKIPWNEIVDYQVLSPAENPDGIWIQQRQGNRYARVGGA